MQELAGLFARTIQPTAKSVNYFWRHMEAHSLQGLGKKNRLIAD